MKIYLLGLTVVTSKTQFVSRGFGKTDDTPIGVETIQRWEGEATAEYREDYPSRVVRIFSFQELG